jgi:hypothetical protein
MPNAAAFRPSWWHRSVRSSNRRPPKTEGPVRHPRANRAGPVSDRPVILASTVAPTSDSPFDEVVEMAGGLQVEAHMKSRVVAFFD